ncbi:Zinc/iron permease [Gamsiella multidivaricata]|uniref:Zinc/iron permease n=1 Tax=Gamsiella multidivaricata TaxID=101098 RepID=UPI00221EC7C2|nr:Zinc/iron permease [Gamsiella multidivaricata]KAG0361940.1 hypothetical protein BGZ54_008856 [Gamsiella multidivaricata]KAI7831278.1 Zinc/iron permease [Gamsiella multidivaricata]
MTAFNGTDDYRAWMYTLASTMACVFGAGLIFIDTIVKAVSGQDVQILQNHKFLAGSLGLGSGVMIFSSFYNLLPEAKEQLSSELSIFAKHADMVLLLFFFGGVGFMALIHWIMHRFESRPNSPGIESSDAIEQFMQREAGQQSPPSSLPQHRHAYSRAKAAVPNGTYSGTGNTSAAPASTARVCEGCVQEESDEADEEVRYDDSEYVDDEVASLLNNAFLQIGKTPNSRMDDGTPHMERHHNRNGDRDYKGTCDDDAESIEVVIDDQKDKILRRAPLDHSDHDLDLDFDDLDIHGGLLKSSTDSLSSASTHSQKPFAPVNKRRKSGNAHKVKGRKHAKDCPKEYSSMNGKNHAAEHAGKSHPTQNHHHQQQQPRSGGINTMSTYGAVSPPNNRHYSGSLPSFPRPEQGAHLRRTSFPRLKGASTIYSKHDVLDHAGADDREHADLTEVGIQTALTIAIHKFPEGLITFLSTTADPCLGFSVFMAIAVHNLIEGYLIAFPLYIGLHSRTKAFALAAALGGLSQPLGAVLGWFILHKVESMGWQVSATGCIYAMVAGMMSSIAVNGMWPQAIKCVGRSKTKVVQYSFFGGIAAIGICQAAMGTKCDL